MSVQLATGWGMDLERGPDWLFVRLHAPPAMSSERSELADSLWKLLEQEFVFRLVLELDAIPLLHSHLMGELLDLSGRIYSHGGMLRICGLSESNLKALRISRLDGKFSCYACRADAVMGHRPANPR